MVTVTMGDLVDLFFDKWVVVSFQEGLEEVIGPFDSMAEAQIWSSENFSAKDEIRHKVVWLVTPYNRKG